MAREAHHEHLLVNDSDIRVAPGYLRRVIAPLADQKTGLVTCLYRGVAAPTLGSHLESLASAQISLPACWLPAIWKAEFISAWVPRWRFAAVTLRRLADLNLWWTILLMIMKLEAHREQRLEDCAVGFGRGHISPHYSFSGFFGHQLRWARSIRDSRRWGYMGMMFTFGGPWALLALILAHGAIWAWGLLAAAALLVPPWHGSWVAELSVIGR